VTSQESNASATAAHATLPQTPSVADARQTARRRVLAVLALVALALIWGYAWVVMKVALRYVQPLTFAALRTFLGAVALFALLCVLRRPLRPMAVRWTVAVGLLQTTGFLAFSTLALYFGGAGRTAVLTYTMPFWLLLLAWVLLGERLRGLQWAALALALAGFVLMLAPWKLGGALSTVLAVAGGFTWAASAVVIKVMQRRHRVDLLSFTAWQMLFGSLPLIALAAFSWSQAPTWSATFIWALSFAVLAGNAIGWFLWLFVLRTFLAGRAGIGTLAIPVVGLLTAWIQLGERPSLSDAVGMTSILTGLAMITVTEAVRGRRATQVLLPAE
jgi:drug/metabolite transporter (DMT)-like permease